MTRTLLGLHIRNTSNIGDRWCHPLDYFDFSDGGNVNVIKDDVREPPRDLRPDYVVLGGGAIARHAPDMVAAYPDARFIAWGIGSTSPRMEAVTQSSHEKFSKKFDLWGGRDYGSSETYVPCVSCMHSLFDNPPPPVHEVVVYSHAGRRPLDVEAKVLGLPHAANNNKADFASAIAHIASGETVITSSFHGVYWATLLGRKVAMIPFGSKFYSLKFQPPAVETVGEGAAVAVRFTDALSDCREITVDFADKVKRFISGD